MNSITLVEVDKRSGLVTLVMRTIILLTFYSSIVNNALSPRVFQMSTVDDVIKNGLAAYVRTGTTILVLGLCCLLILLRTTMHKKHSRNEIVIWGAAMFLSCGPLFSSILGYKQAFASQWFVLPLCFTVLLLLEHDDLKWFVKQFRLLCLVYIYGSLLNAFVEPSNAVDAYNSGIFSFRLHGIAPHANSLGPMSFLFFIINRLYIVKKPNINWIHYVAAITVLLLAQSKTTWIAVFFILVLTWIITMGNKSSLYTAISFFVAAGAVIAIYYFVKDFSNGLSGEEMQSLTTFTGRKEVWHYTIDIWKKNPLFGYGLSLWKDESRLQFYSLYHWAPGQAHNQFFQTLGQSGLIGVLGLIVYLPCLLFFAVKFGMKSKWTIFSIVCLIIVRGFMESALDSNLFTENYTIHFVGFALLMLYVKAPIEKSQMQRNEHGAMSGSRHVFAENRRVIYH